MTSRYKWLLVAMLFLIGALNYADRTAISSVFPLLQAEMRLSDTALASIGSLFLWSYAACSPGAGWLGDRLSRPRLVVLSLTGWSVVTILTGFAQTAGQLLLLRVALGAAECLYVPAAIALIADHHGRETRGTAIAIHNSGLGFGLVAGAGLAGYFGDHFGWRPAFHLLGSTGLALAVTAHLFLREGPQAQAAPETAREPFWSGAADLLKMPIYGILVAEAMCVAIGIWMLSNWLPLYFKETFSLSLTQAGLSATLLPKITTTTGSTLGGWVSDRVARLRPERRMLLQCCFYFLSAPFLLVFLGGWSYTAVAVCVALFYLFRSLGSTNESPVLCDLLPPHRRSTAFGVFNMAQTLAGGAGIMMAGVLKRDYGLPGVFGGISVLMAAAGLFVLMGYLFLFPRGLARPGMAQGIEP